MEASKCALLQSARSRDESSHLAHLVLQGTISVHVVVKDAVDAKHTHRYNKINID